MEPKKLWFTRLNKLLDPKVEINQELGRFLWSMKDHNFTNLSCAYVVKLRDYEGMLFQVVFLSKVYLVTCMTNE